MRGLVHAVLSLRGALLLSPPLRLMRPQAWLTLTHPLHLSLLVSPESLPQPPAESLTHHSLPSDREAASFAGPNAT